MTTIGFTVLAMLVKGSLVLTGAAVLAAWSRRRSAALRHAIWTAGLVAAAMLPLITWAVPRVEVAVLPGIPAPRLEPIAPSEPTSEPAATVMVSGEWEFTAPATEVAQGRDLAESAIGSGWTPQGALPVVWLLGVGLGLGWLLIGELTARRLGRGARSAGAAWSAVEELRRAAGIARPVRVVELDSDVVPFTYGWFRPVIVVPRVGARWSDDHRRDVLSHELAHVRRHDCLTHAVARIAAMVHWPNPLVWVAVRRARLEREHACDDAVLTGGATPSRYAEALLTTARSMDASLIPVMAGVAMARPSELASRLGSVLDGSRIRAGISSRSLGMTGVVTLAVVLPLAALVPVPASPPGDDRTSTAALVAADTLDPIPQQPPRARRPPRTPSAPPTAPLPDRAPNSASGPAAPLSDLAPSSASAPAAPLSDLAPNSASAPAAPLAPSAGAPRPAAITDAPLTPAAPATSRPKDAPSAPSAVGTPPSPSADSPRPPAAAMQSAWSIPADEAPSAAGPRLSLRQAGAPCPVAKDGNRTVRLNSSMSITGQGHASNGKDTYVAWTGRDCSVVIHLVGTVRFTADERDVATLSDGGRFDITHVDGRREREYRIRARSGGLDRRYLIEGEAASDDAEVAEWRAAIVLAFIRRSGYEAEARARRLLAERGPTGLFAEIDQIGSDWVAGRYFRALLAMPDVDGALATEAVARAGRRIESDYELGQVLGAVPARLLSEERVRTGFVGAAATMESDFEMAKVLKGVLTVGRPSPAIVRAFQLSREMESDFELASWLKEALETGAVGPELGSGLFAAAETIGSDFELAGVLVAAVQRGLTSGENRAAIRRLAGTIESTHERQRVMAALGDRLAEQ